MVLLIDYDDAAFVGWGATGWIGLILFIIVLAIAMCNDSECSKKTCPNGAQPKLMEHECLCVERAR